MKRLFVLMSCAVLLSACGSRAPKAPVVSPVAVVKAHTLTDANGNTIENVPFRAGVSSVTVEKLAEAQGCTGGQGAGLLTPQGPVEIYRMLCDNRQVYTARCEMRQCRQMSMSQAGGYAVYQVPADSNIVVATVPAAAVATAPVSEAVVSTAPVSAPTTAPETVASAQPAQPAGQGKLSAKQVPRLAFYWKCGECVKNELVPPIVARAYELEAIKNGYTVSDAEIANVSIVAFRQRHPAARVMFGMFAGKDTLSTKIFFRDKTFVAEDYMVNAMIGMNGISENVGRLTFKQLRAAQ
jgi:hypothetical protein